MKKILNSTSLKINLASNFIGNAWTALISIIFVPFYIRYIGAEGYGLLGVFTTMQVILSLLDSGLTTTLNRELAGLSVVEGTTQRMRNMVRTLEIVYCGIAFGIGVLAVALSPVLAHNWVKPEELSVQTVQYSFMLLGTSLMFQFPIGFYSGGLLGLQKHALLNLIRIFFSTLRSVGALFVLMYYSGSVISFFTWILLVTFLNLVVIRLVLWKQLPAGKIKAIFDKTELKRVWRFIAGMSGIAVTSVLLLQIDKIVLSNMLPLRQFGYYSIATTLSSVLYQICNPVTQSFFPKFSALVSKGSTEALKKVYHQGCQLITVAAVPAALMLVIYSKELIHVWTNNFDAVSNMWKVAAIFAFGTMFHVLMLLPYMLQLSYGKTRLPFLINIVLLFLVIPGVAISANYYGAEGAAAYWAGLNIIYFFIIPFLIHRHLLTGETKNWYWSDTIKPALGIACVIVMWRFIIHFDYTSRLSMLAILTGIGLSGMLAGIALSRGIRDQITGLLTRKKIFLNETV